MADPLDGLQAKTLREILLVLASEMHHMQNHTADLAKEVGKQHGRISALAGWRYWLLGVFAVIAVSLPVFIFGVRQWAGIAGG